VPGELVELGERAGVQQRLDPLPGGHLPGRVLLVHRARRPGVRGLLHPALEVGQLAGGGVQVEIGGDVFARALQFGGTHSAVA
jgi:hypothetical protein